MNATNITILEPWLGMSSNEFILYVIIMLIILCLGLWIYTKVLKIDNKGEFNERKN